MQGSRARACGGNGASGAPWNEDSQPPDRLEDAPPAPSPRPAESRGSAIISRSVLGVTGSDWGETKCRARVRARAVATVQASHLGMKIHNRQIDSTTRRQRPLRSPAASESRPQSATFTHHDVGLTRDKKQNRVQRALHAALLQTAPATDHHLPKTIDWRAADRRSPAASESRPQHSISRLSSQRRRFDAR